MKRPATAPGFTLAEVVLALSVTGLILVAAASLLTDYSTIWLRQGDDQAFEAHADGLHTFLDDLFQRQPHRYVPGQDASVRPRPVDGSADEEPRPGSTIDGLAWDRPPETSPYTDPMLRVALPEDLGPLLAGSGPVLRQTGYLAVQPERGLVLIWTQALLPVERVDDLFSRVLSPYVTDWHFWYHDPDFDTWDREDAPRPAPENPDNLQLPAFITLSLSHRGRSRTLRLSLPAQNADVLQF